MCDTFVALASATANGSVIFGKNSDREPNEAHHLVLAGAEDHAPGSSAACTYISIPQAEHTHAVLLAKPFWIWGAEMGANEHGVVIGNEAVFTKVPYEKGPGLIGMDFLRLALERASTARTALDVIVKLLETHGQGGSCGLTHGFYYHNSFLIADAHDAWVLETAGREWAAEQVRDVRSISNALTIGSRWDLASEGLVDYAVQRGWCKGRDDFDFARCYSDPLYTRLGEGGPRQCRTTALLQAQRGQVDPLLAMSILRDHGGKAGWSPDHGLLGAEVCMHAGFGPVRNSQSTGSMVSEISEGGAVHWLTGTSAPCTSVFKPVWMDAGLPDQGPSPSATYDPALLWWRHEDLHRDVLRGYAARAPLFAGERDALERAFSREAAAACSAPAADRLALSRACFARAGEAEQRWLEQVRAAPVGRGPGLLDKLAWQTFDRQSRRR